MPRLIAARRLSSRFGRRRCRAEPSISPVPAPGLSRDQQIEAARARFPLLKGRLIHRQAVRTPDRGHPRVRLHTDELAPPIGKQPAGDARAAPDIENHPRVAGEEIFDEGGGITGTSPVCLLYTSPSP